MELQIERARLSAPPRSLIHDRTGSAPALETCYRELLVQVGTVGLRPSKRPFRKQPQSQGCDLEFVARAILETKETERLGELVRGAADLAVPALLN
jgi:hypothetical protein